LHHYPIPYSKDSFQLFAKVSDLPFATWLDSNSSDAGARYDIISADPKTYFKVYQDYSLITEGQTQVQRRGCPFEIMQQYLQKLPPVTASQHRFCGGLLGFFSYELGLQLPFNQVKKTHKKNTIGLPLASAGIYHWSLVQDHTQQRAWLLCLDSVTPAEAKRLLKRLSSSQNYQPGKYSCAEFSADISQATYLKKFKEIDRYIKSGDCYQVNFSQRFSAAFCGDSLTAYRHLRQQLPSPYSAYIKLEQGAILSHSPERFIQLTGNQISTKPIKGTAPRHSDPKQDERNAEELLGSKKNQAENLMIVDLMRNDLSRSSRLGSVKVPQLYSLESYRNVHHLVSTVTAELASNCNPLSLFKNSFPGGSITGAPKRRAMQIIEELECSERSAYCGSIAYISACGNMDSSITIRTLVDDGNGQIHCWGGGGIVADSAAESEYQESLSKVGILMRNLMNMEDQS